MNWLEELAGHIAGERWDAALVLALEQWRIWRVPELADLVDALSARCAQPILDARRAGDRTAAYGYYEWLDHAVVYEPVIASALLATIGYWDDSRPGLKLSAELSSQRLAIEQSLVAIPRDHVAMRLRFASEWPPDSRVTWAMLEWCEELTLGWPRGWYGRRDDDAVGAFERAFEPFAAYAKSLADARGQPRWQALAERPPGATNASRAIQRQIAKAALDGMVPPDVELPADKRARTTELVDRVGRITRAEPAGLSRKSFLPDDMWLEVARFPDDNAPRQVLADALLERGDSRGELISLQLQQRHENVHVARFIRRHWHEWLGDDIAGLVLRRKSRFVRGMLDTITLGPGSMPGWRYDAAVGHRELLCVRVVRPNIADPADYARVVASLPNVCTIGLDSVAMANALAAHGPFPTVTALELYAHGAQPSVVDPLRPLATCVPQLVQLQLFRPPALEEVAELRVLFGKLAKLVIAVASPTPAQLQLLAELPGLVVEWRKP